MSSRVKGATKSKKKEKAQRSVDPTRTREALIDAAVQLFAEQGLDGPSLDAICERAGFTRGAFYVHFKTREDLIAAAIERAMGGFLDAVVAGPGVSLEMVVRTFALAVQHGAFPLPGRVRPHQVIDACVRSERIRTEHIELLQKARDRLLAILREDSGVRRDVDPDAIATLLLAIVLGVQIAAELRAPFDAAGASDALLTMLAPSAK